MISLIRDQVEKAAAKKSEQGDGTFVVPKASIRATIAQIGIALEDIRTTKSDPNSTKKFCSASAKITFPIKLLSDADSVRAAEEMNSVDNLADAVNAQRNANAFSFNVDYDVQPTDDRSKIYAESDSIGPEMEFVAELLVSGLLKPNIDSQEAAKQQQLQQQQDAEKQAAQADHDQAVTDNKLSAQAISAAWNAIDVATREQLLDQQRNWIAAKDANCKIQAASASIDPMVQETSRLKCDTAANQSRTNWLKQYIPGVVAQ